MIRKREKGQSKPSSYAGNVLFLILIAVALFAGLTYVVTSTIRNSGGDINEDVTLDISDTLQYVTALRTAAGRLYYRDCREEMIDFYEDTWAERGNYEHTAPSEKCKMFHPNGAGLSFRVPEHNKASPNNSFVYTGQARVLEIGTDEAELFMTAPVDRIYCMMMNETLDIENTGGNPPVETQAFIPHTSGFNGGRTAQGGYNNTVILGDESPQLRGKDIACVFDPDDNLYIFYAVITQR